MRHLEATKNSAVQILTAETRFIRTVLTSAVRSPRKPTFFPRRDDAGWIDGGKSIGRTFCQIKPAPLPRGGCSFRIRIHCRNSSERVEIGSTPWLSSPSRVIGMLLRSARATGWPDHLSVNAKFAAILDASSVSFRRRCLFR